MLDKKIDEKEALELKKFHTVYLHKRKKNMAGIRFEIEDIFGDIKSKDNISQDQIIKIINFLAKMM